MLFNRLSIERTYLNRIEASAKAVGYIYEVWEKKNKRLVAYAIYRLNTKTWKNDLNAEPPLTAEDIVSDVLVKSIDSLDAKLPEYTITRIEKSYIRQKTGIGINIETQYELKPDVKKVILNNFYDSIRDEVKNLANRMENRVEFRNLMATVPENSELLDTIYDNRKIVKDLMLHIYEHDVNLFKLAFNMLKGIEKPYDLSKEMGIDVKEIYNMKKRLKRCISNFAKTRKQG